MEIESHKLKQLLPCVSHSGTAQITGNHCSLSTQACQASMCDMRRPLQQHRPGHRAAEREVAVRLWLSSMDWIRGRSRVRFALFGGKLVRAREARRRDRIESERSTRRKASALRFSVSCRMPAYIYICLCLLISARGGHRPAARPPGRWMDHGCTCKTYASHS